MRARPPSSFSKAQASTEYLVLLAIALILAIIGLGVSGFFPSFSYDAQAGDSMRYWANAASPIAIIDAKQSNATLQLELENRASANLHLTGLGMKLRDTTYQPASLPVLPPGGRAAVSLTTVSCTGHQSLSYAVQINYSTDQVGGLAQAGAKPLYITCSD